MRRRTTIDLDHELVAAASLALQTRRIVDTVHAALEEAVARQRRAQLVQMPLPDLTPASVEAIRASRTVDEEGDEHQARDGAG